jgi:HK97 family phage prohead protease
MRAYEFSAPLEIKLARSGGEITGYGSTFHNEDRGGDVVAPGAFAKSLAEHRDSGAMPAMLWSHDINEPIGVWHEATEDGKGLLLKGKLTTETRRGAEARALAKDGALALSIGYQTRDADYADGARVLKDVRLHEVSLVRVSVKNAMAAESIRDAIAFERFLKEQGFANSLARRLAAGWNEAVKRSDADAADLINMIRAHTSGINGA